MDQPPTSPDSSRSAGPADFRTMARRRFRLVGAGAGARVLVVGCGTGDDVLSLARLVRPGGRAFGVDRTEATLREARRRATTAGLAAKFHLGAPDDLPFPDASFDGVCAAWLALEDLDPEEVVRELLRVVRPEGRMVIDAVDWSRVPDVDALTRATRAAGLAVVRREVDRLARADLVVNLTITDTAVRDTATDATLPCVTLAGQRA